MSDQVPVVLSEAQPATIDVGETDGKLRLWLAQEAMRQADARFKEQAAVLSSLQARATNVIGWSATGLLALAAALISKRVFLPALATAALIAASIILSVLALLPGVWSTSAWPPGWYVGRPYESQLEVLEATAGGADLAIEKDDKKLRRVAWTLRAAYLCLAVAPIVGFLLVLFTSA